MVEAMAVTLIFSPHPDDETIACGGAILNRTTRGKRVHICFSTDGSQSHKAVLGLDIPTPGELREIRHGEALAAARCLGVPPEFVTFAGAKDTELRAELDHFRNVVDDVLGTYETIDEVFIPHEVRELNADHSLTGQIVLERLAAAGITPKIFKYVVWDAEVEAAFGYMNRRDEEFQHNGKETLVREDITAHLERKYEAFLEHKTQTSLFVKQQDRLVVPENLFRKVQEQNFEEFWIAG